MAEFLDNMDFSEYYQESEVIANILPSSAYLQAVKDSIRHHHTEEKVFLPWEKANPFFDFRKGEVTIWAGQNGHGKSQVTDQVKLSLLGQDQKVGNASFEMKPVTNLRRMARMHFKTNPFHPAYNNEDGMHLIDGLFGEFCGWTNNRLWMFNQTGNTCGQKVKGFVRYCAKELKLDHIFVDNLAKCVSAEDGYNEQKAFIGEMCSIAHDYNVHIHVVHHLKKPAGGEGSKPDKTDIKGSGAITDQPDNIMLVWRNKPKEDEMKAGSNSKQDEPDCLVYCKKQRNYEGNEDNEPTIALWLHRDSLQFLGSKDAEPMWFPNYPHRES